MLTLTKRDAPTYVYEGLKVGPADEEDEEEGRAMRPL